MKNGPASVLITLHALLVVAGVSRAQTPIEDVGFTTTTPLPDADAVIVREKAIVGPFNLSAYTLGTGHTYIQSIYFRFFKGGSATVAASFTGRVVFPPSVTIVGFITDGTKLGGATDNGQWTDSDADFGIGSNPDAYSELARGFETGGATGSSEFVCQTAANSFVFGLNIGDGVDDFRVIIDYGDSFPSDMAFDVANYDVPSFGGATPSQGFQIGDVGGAVLGSGDFGEVGSVLRIPLTSSLPTNPSTAIPSDPTHNLAILRDTSVDTYVDAFDFVYDLPEPEAITIPAATLGGPVGLTGGPDGYLYAIGGGGGYAVLDSVTRSVVYGVPLPDLTGDNVELTALPGTRDLLIARDTTGNTFVDRVNVDSHAIVQTYTVLASVVGGPVGVAVGTDGFAYVLGGGGGFARLNLTTGNVTSLTLTPPAGTYYDLASSSVTSDLYLVRSAGSGTFVDRFNTSTAMIQNGFAFTTAVGAAVGICEGPGGDLFIIGGGGSGAAGFARISPANGMVLESHTCLDFPGTNIDIAFSIPFQSEAYCTAKTNSQACVPAIAASGIASATNTSSFTISAVQVVNNKSGILFYGLLGNTSPFQGGVLCVKQPVRRTPIQNSGGNPPPDDCSGAFAFDFNALIDGGSDASLVPPTEVFCQYWYRDPADPTGFNTGLSNGLRFTIAP